MRLLLLLCLLPVAAAAQTKADMQCKATGKDLIYDCVIRLARGGEPVNGAQLTVGADMPSMPMTHSVKPVKARPGKARVWVYPKCRAGRLVADVERLDKGHTEGLEPHVTEAIVKLMVSAPGGGTLSAM